ncbi:MAG: aspartyl protease family protein [Candidatus Omnitrophica bacterium]|nr:aspartyl protease family protein [Candidatus Omnitrophota bacterium]
MRFPYARVRGGRAPIIPIRVLGRRRWQTIPVYVDSGAYCSILRPEAARRLGIHELLAQRVTIRTSGGRTTQLDLYRLAARIGTWRGLVTFGVPHGFDLEFNLLGRIDVFDQFAICFDDAAGALTLTPSRRRAR